MLLVIHPKPHREIHRTVRRGQVEECLAGSLKQVFTVSPKAARGTGGNKVLAQLCFGFSVQKIRRSHAGDSVSEHPIFDNLVEAFVTILSISCKVFLDEIRELWISSNEISDAKRNVQVGETESIWKPRPLCIALDTFGTPGESARPS